MHTRVAWEGPAAERAEGAPKSKRLQLLLLLAPYSRRWLLPVGPPPHPWELVPSDVIPRWLPPSGTWYRVGCRMSRLEDAVRKKKRERIVDKSLPVKINASRIWDHNCRASLLFSDSARSY